MGGKQTGRPGVSRNMYVIAESAAAPDTAKLGRAIISIFTKAMSVNVPDGRETGQMDGVP